LGENGSDLFEEEFSWRDWERPLTASVSQSIRCPSQDSKETPSELKSELLELGPIFFGIRRKK